MEREKNNCENVSRTIQQKNNIDGAYMLDNRSEKNQNYLSDSPLQQISNEVEDSFLGKNNAPVQIVEEEEYDTLQGKCYDPIQKKNETNMPDNLKVGIESLSGFSMDDVRVHYNSSKPATVQALAYTQGTDIHVAPGQEKHLPHEAWHVVQQMAGRVSPTTTINGMPVNDNAALEHEADVMGAKAVQRLNVKTIINAEKHPLAQKKDANSAASVLDASSQGEFIHRKADMANSTMQRAKGNTPKNRSEKMALLEDDVKKLNKLNQQLAKEDEIKIDFISLSHLKELRSLSDSDFDKKFNFYYYSGGRNIFLNSFCFSKAKKTDPKRTECNVDDEKFFYKYLNKHKKTVIVYRGDSRKKHEDHLKAGGTPCISFLGVIEHQKSSSNKNGMVSTTTKRNVAKDFLNKNGGILYKIKLDDYIDVNYILAKRNFKNLFPTQFEVLSIGDISNDSVLHREEISATNSSTNQQKVNMANESEQRDETSQTKNTGMPDNL